MLLYPSAPDINLALHVWSAPVLAALTKPGKGVPRACGLRAWVLRQHSGKDAEGRAGTTDSQT